MFKPVKVIDVELSEPLSNIEGLRGYAFLQALVRLHGSPIGYIRMPVINGSCSRADIANAILEKHASPIIQHLLFEGLSGNIPPESFYITNLLRSQQPASRTVARPLVTVAVCTRDNTAFLNECLESLILLDYPNLDIVIIDNAPSSDSTERLIRTQYKSMRYFREPRPGLDWARNRAIIEARGEIIAYTDDDVIVDRRWITALTKIFSEHPDVMAVTGLVVPSEMETEAQELFELYSGFGRGFKRRWATLHGGTGQFGTGANMAYRSAIFEEIGYFDPALDVGTATNGGGDLDMFFRILKGGHTLVYEPNAIVRHCHRRSYSQLHAQIANWGIGFFSYLTRNVLVYPDERVAFARLGLWWFWRKFRAVVLSFMHPSRLRDLCIAELKGSCIGLFRYYKARSTAKNIMEKFGPLSESVAVRSRRNKRRVPDYKKASAVLSVELSEPLTELTDLDDFARVQILVTLKGKPLGTVDLDVYGPSVSRTRLCQAIVDRLGLKLLRTNGSRNSESLWSETYTALRRHYMPEENGTYGPGVMQLPSNIPVSIVLATYDRPDDLFNCLCDLRAQKSPRRIEIIVVDNNPSSGLTPPVVANFPGVVLVDEPRKGLSYARNKGFTTSSGDIVIATDDDVSMPADWLEKLVARFVRSDVMIVTGNVLPMELETAAQNLFEVYGGLGRGFETLEYGRKWFDSHMRRAVPTWKLGATANAAFRASIFTHPEIGLMDEALGPGTPSGVGEDTYLFFKVLKAGYTILYEPMAYVWHRHRRDIPALRRQIYNYSKGHVAYHLTTLTRDHDVRALLHLLIHIPKWRFHQIMCHVKARLRGRITYPLSLILLEMAGNLAGPLTLWRSRWRVRRLGHSQPYIPLHRRSAPALESQLNETETMQNAERVPEQV